MAVKASAHITLYSVVDIQATYRYYLLQSSTLSKPSVPTMNPPSDSWVDSEPTYTSGSTNSLYFVDLTVFSNGTFSYSEVSLSTAYEAAKEAYNKAVAAQGTADSAQQDIDELEVGSRNLLLNTKSMIGSNIVASTLGGISADTYNGFSVYTCDFSSATSGYVDMISFQGIYPEKLGDTYTLSFYAKGTASDFTTYFHGASGYLRCAKTVQSNGTVKDYSGDGTTKWSLTDSWTRYWVTWTLDTEGDISIEKYVLFRLFYGGTASICGVKLEKGNKATDWTPAPEDVDSNISDVEESLREDITANTERLNSAILEIDSINAMIKSLVTGENGETLMTQTDTGWAFDFSSFQSILNAATENISDLDSDLSDTNSVLETVKQNVEDLGIYTEYIEFGVDNGQPCIILGEHDSEFKVVITNTEIRFMEGQTTPAYISNQSLNISKAVISEELQQGGFVWMARSNGNYGLIWKGE